MENHRRLCARLVEMILRVAATVVGAIPVLTASAIVLSSDLLKLPSSIRVLLSDPDTIDGTVGAAGYAVGLAAMAILIDLLVIFFLFSNIAIIKIIIFPIADIAFSTFFALGFLAAGVAMAIFAKRWNDGLGTVSFIVGILTPPSAAEAITSAVTAEVENVRNALAAGAAFSFVALILFAVLAVWSMMKMVKYTLKETATG